jgi:hypothetical protein
MRAAGCTPARARGHRLGGGLHTTDTDAGQAGAELGKAARRTSRSLSPGAAPSTAATMASRVAGPSSSQRNRSWLSPTNVVVTCAVCGVREARVIPTYYIRPSFFTHLAGAGVLGLAEARQQLEQQRPQVGLLHRRPQLSPGDGRNKRGGREISTGIHQGQRGGRTMLPSQGST